MTQNPIVLKELTPPIKVLFTGYLCTVGIGYMFALIQILFTHGMADGKFGLSVDDIVYSYYGNRSGTVLEQKLNGSMKENAPEQERFKLMEWVRSGADAEEYKDDGIEKIIQTRCVMCHNKEASGLPDFTSLKGLSAYTAQDTGATFASLTRVSHVHMFGISFIFMFVGLIFSFSETTTNQYKCIAIGMPYVFLVADIMSWWLTKIHPMFAWLVILAGMGMAVSFIFMWATSLLEMWLFTPVFINGLDSRYLKWRESTEASAVDKIWLLVKALPSKIRPVSVLIIDLWLQHGWPVIIGLFKK
jgi:cytochrome c553